MKTKILLLILFLTTFASAQIYRSFDTTNVTNINGIYGKFIATTGFTTSASGLGIYSNQVYGYNTTERTCVRSILDSVCARTDSNSVFLNITKIATPDAIAGKFFYIYGGMDSVEVDSTTNRLRGFKVYFFQRENGNFAVSYQNTSTYGLFSGDAQANSADYADATNWNVKTMAVGDSICVSLKGDSVRVWVNGAKIFTFYAGSYTRTKTHYRWWIGMPSHSDNLMVDNFYLNKELYNFTPPTPLSAPTLLTPTDLSINQNYAVQLKWTTVTGANKYKVMLDDDASFGSPLINISTGNSDTTYTTDSTLAWLPRTIYYWKIKVDTVYSDFSTTLSYETRQGVVVDPCNPDANPIIQSASFIRTDSTVNPAMILTDLCGVQRMSVYSNISGSSTLLDTLALSPKQTLYNWNCDTTLTVAGADTITYVVNVWDAGGSKTSQSYIVIYLGINVASGLWNTGYFAIYDYDSWYKYGGNNPLGGGGFNMIYDYQSFSHYVIFNEACGVSATSPYFNITAGSADSNYIDTQFGRARVDSVHKYGGKVLVSFPGLGSAPMANVNAMITDPVKRATWIHVTSDWMKRKGYDGYEFDWEYPSTQYDQYYYALLKELRDTLNTWSKQGYIIIAAYMYQHSLYRAYPNFFNSDSIDQINIMCYGQGRNTIAYQGYSAAIYPPAGVPGAYPSMFNSGLANADLTEWAKYINKNKIGGLFTFETHPYSGTSAPLQTGGAFGNYQKYVTMLADVAAHPGNEHWDNVAKVPWAGWTEVGGAKKFWTYEDTTSIRYKIQAIKDSGFAGIGIWDYANSYTTKWSPTNYLEMVVKNAWGNPVGDTTGKTPPLPPTLVSPTNGAVDQMLNPVLVCNKVTDATTYWFEMSPDSIFTFDSIRSSITYDTMVTMYNIMSPSQIGQLQTSKTYYWRVRSVYPNGIGGYTVSAFQDTFHFRTIVSPDAPQLFYPINNQISIIPSSTSLLWGAVTGASMYYVQLDTSANFSTAGLPYTTFSSTSYSLNGLLQANKRYYWRVRAFSNTTGYTDWSISRSFTVLNIPSAPTLVYPTNTASGLPLSFPFKWNSVPLVSYYGISLSKQASGGMFREYIGSSSNILDTTVTVLSNGFNDVVLQENSTYFWKVYAVNEMGASDWSAEYTFYTMATPSVPVVPTLVSPSNNAANQEIVVKLKWNLCPTATSYNIICSKNNFVDTVENIIQSDTSVNIGILENATTYKWKVRATNTVGSSNFSTERTFTTKTVLDTINTTRVRLQFQLWNPRLNRYITSYGKIPLMIADTLIIGDANTDGSWMFMKDGSDLLLKFRKDGIYQTKQTWTP